VYLSIELKCKSKLEAVERLKKHIDNPVTLTDVEYDPIKKFHTSNLQLHFLFTKFGDAYASYYQNNDLIYIVVFGETMNATYNYSRNLLYRISGHLIKDQAKISKILVNYGTDRVGAKFVNSKLSGFFNEKWYAYILLLVLSIIIGVSKNSLMQGVAGSIIATVIVAVVDVFTVETGLLLDNPEGACV